MHPGAHSKLILLMVGLAFVVARCGDINLNETKEDTVADTTAEDTAGEDAPWQCTTDDECEGVVTPSGQCEFAKCDGGECVVSPVEAGTTCTEGQATQCTTLACDGSGACTSQDVDDGTACDDDDACTQTDECASGACVGSDPVICEDPGQCLLVGTCDPTTGECTDPAFDADGTDCDDGDACTTVDACLQGACVGGEPVVCQALDQCHVAGECDTTTGTCSDPAVDDGTTCDDGNAETGNDTCQAGVCLGEGCTCNTVDACCDGCLPLNEEGVCAEDGLDCTTDTCLGGVCSHVPDSTSCVIDDTCFDDTTTNPANDCQYCDSVYSQTQWRLKLDGTECDDGDALTGDDTCTAGTCAGEACECTEEGPCCDGCFFVNDYGPCADDGIVCTNDVCTDGACTHPVSAGYCLVDTTCYPDGSGNPDNSCEYCDSVFDSEGWRSKIDGTGCEDGDLCTTGDACSGGTCASGDSITCTALDQCHVAGTCDPETGSCSDPAADDDTACDDGNEATGNDTCQAGTCLGEGCICSTIDDCCDGCLPINDGSGCADDGFDCTSDVCNYGTCLHVPITGWCLIGDVCYEDGSADPLNECQYCNAGDTPEAWFSVDDDTTCTDADLCTQASSCQAGTCIGSDPIVCQPLDQCHMAGECDPDTGTCSDPAKDNGEPCDDGDLCSLADTCQDGVCTSTESVVCGFPPSGITAPDDQCWLEGVCDSASGDCAYEQVVDGTTCDDGDSATGGDSCQGGACVGGGCTCSDEIEPGVDNPCCQDCLAVDGSVGTTCVDDGISCTDDLCNANGQCVHELQSGFCLINKKCFAEGEENPANQCQRCASLLDDTGWTDKDAGATCDDDSACTEGDNCQGGTCKGDVINCDDGNVCTIDGCNPETGCVTVPYPVELPCDDGDKCTYSDVCGDGVCTGKTKTCTTPPKCHAVGTCKASTGTCSYPELPDETECNDGLKSTYWDWCIDGTCECHPFTLDDILDEFGLSKSPTLPKAPCGKWFDGCGNVLDTYPTCMTPYICSVPHVGMDGSLLGMSCSE